MILRHGDVWPPSDCQRVRFSGKAAGFLLVWRKGVVDLSGDGSVEIHLTGDDPAMVERRSFQTWSLDTCWTLGHSLVATYSMSCWGMGQPGHK